MPSKLAAVIVVMCLAGCQSVLPESARVTASRLPVPVSQPSHDRIWQPNLARMPVAEFDGDFVTIHNIRNTRYATQDDYETDYYDAKYRLSDLEHVDFLVVPFDSMPSLAHTMLSFGFKDDRYFVVSVEARLEVGEQYHPLSGSLQQYELMYVIGDERDLIPLRTKHRAVNVYLYRTRTTSQQRVNLLVSILDRVNQLAAKPEFYDTLANNCTTNLVQHVNEFKPGRIPPDIRVLFPGHSDRYAYDLGLLDTALPFEELRRRSHVNEYANRLDGSEDFSREIRRHLPSFRK